MKYILLCITLVLMNTHAEAACDAVHNHQFTTLQGEKFNLCDFQDKPMLIVNTASKCGFTPQFERLEGMHKRYKDKGLVIVGFPSNDFRQELSDNKSIGDFCKKTYSVQFPMMAKSSVVGPNANPLYKELATVTKEPPMWNFYKYLVLPDGKIYTYSSDVDPESEEIVSKLKPFMK